MKIIYATYIDHQQEINYPINYLLKHNPELMVFCSDEENKNYCMQLGFMPKIIDFKIRQPGDIASAQNICIDLIFNVYNPDFVVWNQADIFITKKGAKIIEDFCVEKNLDQTAALGLMHIKLFHHCGFTYYGINVIGRDAWPRIKFTGDGAYLGSGGADYCAKEDSSIDIGYLTIEQCRNHIRQHEKTWSSPEIISNQSDKEFVKTVLDRHNYSGLIAEDSEYFELIKDMGLVDEYNKVKELLN